jgi:peptidoglycan hydrolase-like protein with peptidoglycan-binding domain
LKLVYSFLKGGVDVFYFRASVAFVLFAALIAPSTLAASHLLRHRASSSSHTHKHHKATRTHTPRGQQSIEPSRVTEIQQALIREHYLTSEANGKWDAATEAAMRKYQADQGWQTKLMPDSRALKKLGLGPDYSNAINAKDSSFSEPHPASAIPPDQSTGFAAAAGVNQ